jgi:ABC-type nitrate/sulfonate/bicarbonate transport system permease component
LIAFQRAGLGRLLFDSYTVRRYPEMFALALLLVAVALAVNLLLAMLERRVRRDV